MRNFFCGKFIFHVEIHREIFLKCFTLSAALSLHTHTHLHPSLTPTLYPPPTHTPGRVVWLLPRVRVQECCREELQARRDHTTDGSSNEFREVGIESRRPLQNTCAHRSSASRRVRLAVCPAMQQCSACEVENTHGKAEIHYDHVEQKSIMRHT